ncbi:50S ribosomal protein L19-1, chloroplastic [Zostera marina]|uniref:50S ribosomal protein L19-1, chloroplastic n=1 Tax=Zostera marina TaxID=29655 RepID=A0A0K9NUC0_ZOSMR|nr:50S ribosomal protein L19-1, chloroplastic [Zostera marina]
MGSKLLATHSIFWITSTLQAPHNQNLSVSIPTHSRCVRRNMPSIRTGNRVALRAVDGAEGSSVEIEDEKVEDTVEEVKPLRKPIIKLGDVMGILNKRAVDAAESERPVPDIRTGDIVEIKLEVPENRRRASIYKGIVMSRQNAGIHTTIRIRRIIAGIGVEIVFPLYSPNIKELKVVKHRKVRRARLYYLRDKLPRLSTFK